MSLSDLAALGNFVSGGAVLISFVFISLQLRQSARNQRATIHNERTRLVQDLTIAARTGDMALVMLQGTMGDVTMSERDCVSYLAVTLSAFRLFEEFFLQHRDGMLDDLRWQNNALRVRGFMQEPGFRASWRVQHRSFNPDYVAWMNGLLHETTVPAVRHSAPAIWKEIVQQELGA